MNLQTPPERKCQSRSRRRPRQHLLQEIVIRREISECLTHWRRLTIKNTAAGHAVVRAAGGEVWQAPRDGHDPVPDWLAAEPEPANLQPLRYNKESLLNPHFVARGW